jgi:hypothetical protein
MNSNIQMQLIARIVVGLALLGCAGGGDDDEAAEPRKPDTGYGKGATVPSPRTCTDLCTRLGECAGQLCNEDTRSTHYDGLGELLALQCEAGCDETLVNSKLTAEQWQCLFQSSCREAVDYDVCHAQGSYYCN